jgi:hypothetical protein
MINSLRCLSTTIILITISIECFSQQKKLSEKYTKQQFLKDSAEIVKVKLIRPQLRLDNRTFFFNGQVLNISGIDAGVLLKNKLRFTLGYYSLSENLKTKINNREGIEVIQPLQINYGTINTEFMYKNTRFYSLGMPLELGFGFNELKTLNAESLEELKSEKGFIAVADFGLSFIFKPIRWIGIRAILGYRKSIYNQIPNFKFDGAFTSIGLNVDFREIVMDYKLYKIKRRYYKRNGIETAVDLITD